MKPNSYELHITVADATSDRLRWLEAFAKDIGWKYLHIQLEKGETPSQPMLSTKSGNWTYDDALRRARGLKESLGANGFDVTRIKVEAMIWNTEIPRTQEKASEHPDRYFEYHIKVLCWPSEVTKLRSMAEPLGGHVSRNIRKVRDDGVAEIFVTQRCFQVPEYDAVERLSELLLALQDFDILKIEEEYVVFDSNLSLDKGWFEGTPSHAWDLLK